jgi:lipopolysaccharide export LptBFGC system permease protein LptF
MKKKKHWWNILPKRFFQKTSIHLPYQAGDEVLFISRNEQPEILNGIIIKNLRKNKAQFLVSYKMTKTMFNQETGKKIYSVDKTFCEWVDVDDIIEKVTTNK